MLALYHANRIHQQHQRGQQEQQLREGEGEGAMIVAAAASVRLPSPPKGRIGLGGQVGGLVVCGDAVVAMYLLYTTPMQTSTVSNRTTLPSPAPQNKNTNTNTNNQVLTLWRRGTLVLWRQPGILRAMFGREVRC